MRAKDLKRPTGGSAPGQQPDQAVTEPCEGHDPLDAEPAYTIGYGKPPLGSRFAPGRSGNPNGRPRKDQAFKTLLERELAERVSVKEQGRRRKLSRRAVIIKRLVSEAMAGNPKHLAIVLAQDPIVAEVLGEVAGTWSRPPDHSVKAGLVERLRAALAIEPEPPDSASPLEGEQNGDGA